MFLRFRVKSYFMSGKIYQNSPNGKVLSGYFSTVADSSAKESETFNEMFDAVLEKFKVDDSQIHVERFSKL